MQQNYVQKAFYILAFFYIEPLRNEGG